MAGIASTEEVNADRMNEILGVLDEIKIVDVRPKFKFEGKQLLNADLTVADIPELKKNPEKASAALRGLQEDLSEKGFNFGGTAEQLELVSENGELEFGTSKGLLYRLHIGSVSESKDDSIEIGSGSDGEDADESDDADSADDENRFMYVRVVFDETLLGDRPAEPKMQEKPTPPEGYKPAAPKTEKEAGDDDQKDAAEGEADAEPASEDRDPAFIAYEEDLNTWNLSAKEVHEMNLTRFKQGQRVVR